MTKRLSLLGFLFLLGIFFFPVVIGTHGFYAGDHRDQHFPWWTYFVEQIRAGNFPSWTSLISCGFPLAAEGQIGAFYPFNYLFAGFQPETGYNLNILSHFFLGGLIFYFYATSLKLSSKAAAFGTLLYVFGTAKCGYYYNITSQRVLIWFPLALYLTDRILSRLNLISFLSLTTLFAVQIFAGYQQYAGYSIGITFLYALIKTKGKQAIPLLAVLGATLAGIVLSAPQTLPFLQLLSFSSRARLPEQFAYIGSSNPLGLITLFYPDWDDFFTTELFIGVLSLYFVILLLKSKRSVEENRVLIMTLLTYLLAIGIYNPLFVLFVKLTHFGGRVPSKFLYFTSTFLALSATYGMERYLKAPQQLLRQSFKLYKKIVVGMVSLMLLLSIALRVFKEPVLNLGRWFVDRFIIATPAHTHSPEAYYTKLIAWYDALLYRIQPLNFYTLVFSVLMIVSVLLLRYVLKKKRASHFFLIFIFIAVELYAYAQHGVLGNLKPTRWVATNSKIAQTLQADKSFYRTYVYTEDGNYDAFPTYPNFNMRMGIREIGGYSPLMLKKYSAFVEPFGGINNSLSVSTASAEGLKAFRSRLNFLAVKYVLSLKPLDVKDFELLFQEGPVYFYQNLQMLTGFYLAYASIHDITVTEHEVRLKTNRSLDGKVITTIAAYPGWEVRLDGQPIAWQTFESFITVEVPAGMHELVFRYSYGKEFLESVKRYGRRT